MGVDGVATMLEKLRRFSLETLDTEERQALGALLRPSIDYLLATTSGSPAEPGLVVWSADALAEGLRRALLSPEG
jgi:hypothetical protein